MRVISKVAAAMTAAAVLCGAPTAAFATVSSKDASVSVENENGSATAAIDGGTVLTLKGSDFQAIKGGFGGIYVVFGWVSSPEDLSWSPTKGGVTGDNYQYAPDSEDENNKGFSRYIAFEGSKTSALANGGFVAEDGSWETELAVPAAKFESFDREGNPASVDCLKNVCGVITIGAHNVKNGSNETFTPVTFVEDTAATQAPTETPSESPIPDESATPQETGESTAPAETQETSANPSDSSKSEKEGGSLPLPIIIGGVAVVVAAGGALFVKSKRNGYGPAGQD